MKYQKLLLLFAVLLIADYSYAQCTSEDCLKVPITKGCEVFCYSVTDMISSASPGELSLIIGLDSTIVQSITFSRSEKSSNFSFKNFYSRLNEDQKQSFNKSILSLNKAKLEYFKLSKSDRESVIEQLEKIQTSQIHKQ